MLCQFDHLVETCYEMLCDFAWCCVKCDLGLTSHAKSWAISIALWIIISYCSFYVHSWSVYLREDETKFPLLIAYCRFFLCSLEIWWRRFVLIPLYVFSMTVDSRSGILHARHGHIVKSLGKCFILLSLKCPPNPHTELNNLPPLTWLSIEHTTNWTLVLLYNVLMTPWI